MDYIVNVEGAIWHNGHYLMIVRGAEETHAAGTLSFVGGKVDQQSASSDILEETLKREIAEEIAITVSDLTYVHSTHFITDDGANVIDIVFLCRALLGEPTIQDQGEVAEILWLTADEIFAHPKAPIWTRSTLSKVEALRSKLALAIIRRNLMAKTIRWGIIGVGDVTEVKSGPGFQKAEHSALVAVMRRDAAKARDYAERHHVPRWYDDAKALIHDAEVDAVYIATPPNVHLDYTQMAAAAGKPVFVEKPMARTYAECQQMIDACRRAGVPLWVAYYRRRLPRFLKIKALVESGAIGEVRSRDDQLSPHPVGHRR